MSSPHGTGAETEGTGSGGDDWLTTYADAITLLMAFFVMILATADLNQGKYDTVRNSIKNALHGSGENEHDPGSTAEEKTETPAEKKKRKDRAKQAFKRLKVELAEEIQKGSVRVARDGQRVTIEFSSVALFAAGRADLKPGMKPVLLRMADGIQAAGRGDYRIDVEGHTDDVPIRGRYPSNWELSASRATHVVRYLVESGLARGRMRAIGLADTKPKVPLGNAKGKTLMAARAKNRRVVLHVDWGTVAKLKKQKKPEAGKKAADDQSPKVKEPPVAPPPAPKKEITPSKPTKAKAAKKGRKKKRSRRKRNAR